MSTRKSEQIEEFIQLMKIISKNPSIISKNPSIFLRNPLMRAGIIDYIMVDEELSPVPIEFKREREGEINKQINELSQQISRKVLEQIRSDISKLLSVTESQASVKALTQAINESIKMISEIREVKKVFAFVEPKTLGLIIIHDADDKLELLKKIVKIENFLDEKFEDIYFEFETLHHSEIDNDSLIDGMLIFMRV